VIFDWHVFDYDSTTYYLHIAKDFPGIVRKAKINSRPYCLDRKSLWISTDQNKCNLQGSYNCYFCDLDEEVGATGFYNCFPTCKDFGYYFTGLGGDCKLCHNSCRYCKNDITMPDNENCYLCNKTAYFVKDKDEGKTSLAPLNGDTIKCDCSAGTYMSDSRTQCILCDPKCLTCSSFGTDNCDSCRIGAYKMHSSTCSSECPNELYF
jgi:hypothetical protein